MMMMMTVMMAVVVVVAVVVVLLQPVMAVRPLLCFGKLPSPSSTMNTTTFASKFEDRRCRFNEMAEQNHARLLSHMHCLFAPSLVLPLFPVSSSWQHSA